MKLLPEISHMIPSGVMYFLIFYIRHVLMGGIFSWATWTIQRRLLKLWMRKDGFTQEMLEKLMKMIFFISLAGSRYYKHEGFGFMAVSMNSTVFWDVVLCSLVEIY
jgi:hypothetical protein